MHCLQCFSSEKVLNNHKENCITINSVQAIKMPKAGDMVYFKNYHKEQEAPFVIYADFETITEKVYGCQPNNDKSYTESYQKHKDCGYGYKVVCRYNDKYSKKVQIYRGKDAVYKFMEKMLQQVEWCKKMKYKYMTLTKDDEQNFKNANKCHICNKKYSEKDIRVRGHCHITGKYRASDYRWEPTDFVPRFWKTLSRVSRVLEDLLFHMEI